MPKFEVELTDEQVKAIEGSFPNDQETASGAVWLEVAAQLVGLPGQPRKIAVIKPA